MADLNFGSGTIDAASGAGTATVFTSTATKFHTVILCASVLNTSAVYVGDTNVDATGGSERGLEMAKGATVTIEAASAGERGLHGHQALKTINMADLFIDGLTNGDTVTWFGFS